jgi:hypothetical protein
MEIAPGTGMNPDALALLWREPRKREAIQVNETVRELPGGIDLHGKPPSLAVPDREYEEVKAGHLQKFVRVGKFYRASRL